MDILFYLVEKCFLLFARVRRLRLTEHTAYSAPRAQGPPAVFALSPVAQLQQATNWARYAPSMRPAAPSPP